MQIELTNKEFRRLLDMVYIGNWVLNSTRGDDRFADYDDLESKLFGLCRTVGMKVLVDGGIRSGVDVFKALALGASPRASVALLHLCQAYAYLRGRDYVTPDDIASLYVPAVAHRVQLTQESKLSLLSVSDVLTEIRRSVDVPYLGAH